MILAYIYCNTTFKAPISPDSVAGYIAVCLENKTILTLDLYISNYIPAKNYLNFWNTMIKNYTYHLEALFY